jgi:hypothetical protein
MNYQQRLFDNYTVSHERGTLSSFSIEDDDIPHFQADDVLVFVVTATVSGASYKHDTSGDWVRTNKLTTHEVRVADGVMKEEIVEFYNLAGDQLPFVRPGAQSAPSSPAAGGSTHVQPSVASAGNTESDSDEEDEEDEDEEDNQDEQDLSSTDQTARDTVLAAFLDEQSA